MKKAVKIITALLAAAAAIYLIAQYGDTIVAFAKKLMSKCPCMKKTDNTPVAPETEEAPVAEEAVPAVPGEAAEEPAAEEAAPVAENSEPVANEEDFEA